MNSYLLIFLFIKETGVNFNPVYILSSIITEICEHTFYALFSFLTSDTVYWKLIFGSTA
jgi:hypothetical protein